MLNKVHTKYEILRYTCINLLLECPVLLFWFATEKFPMDKFPRCTYMHNTHEDDVYIILLSMYASMHVHTHTTYTHTHIYRMDYMCIHNTNIINIKVHILLSHI